VSLEAASQGRVAGRYDPAGVGLRRRPVCAVVAVVFACGRLAVTVATEPPAPGPAQTEVAGAGATVAAGPQAPEVTPFAAAVAGLKDANYARKAELIRSLAEQRQPGTKELLSALLEGNVYSRTSDGKVFIVAPGSSGYALTDPLTGKGAGTGPEEGFEKVGINNALRRVLRSALAQFDLSSPDTGVRLAAVKEMLRSVE
jgi:urea transport system permease protein